MSGDVRIAKTDVALRGVRHWCNIARATVELDDRVADPTEHFIIGNGLQGKLPRTSEHGRVQAEPGRYLGAAASNCPNPRPRKRSDWPGIREAVATATLEGLSTMIVQACLNGSRTIGFHQRLPLTSEDIAKDGASCIAAGAAELHLHPRGATGKESLAAVDTTILSLRRACPGTLIGVSTGAWIENDEARTRNCIAQWNELPDYASVNLSERDAPAVIDLLRRRGIAVEAGLASVVDAERLVKLPGHRSVLRILIEIEEQDLGVARQVAANIAAVLDRVGLRRPLLLHGVDATVWPFVELARQRRWSTRVGLEDGKHLPDGTIASDNAVLVTAASAMFHPKVAWSGQTESR